MLVIGTLVRHCSFRLLNVSMGLNALITDDGFQANVPMKNEKTQEHRNIHGYRQTQHVLNRQCFLSQASFEVKILDIYRTTQWRI